MKKTYYIPTIEIMDLRAVGVMMWDLNDGSNRLEPAPRRVERRDPAF